MMTAQQLKNSILQRAIEGKLVEQRAEEGTSKELLKEIKLEKEKLVKEGKIKKSKALPPITEDEIPFEIPDSWEWVRLGEILFVLTDGTHQKPHYTDDGIPFLSVKDISGKTLSFDDTKYISQQEHEELKKRCYPQKGDILLSKVGTTGIPVIVDTEAEFSIFVSLALLKFSHRNLYANYVLRLIESPIVQEQCTNNTRGVGNKNWVLRDIGNTLIPLPPLSEQHRIVAKIEELMPLVDQYDKAYSQLTVLNEKFPQDMKKSILQYAIEGKLVEQRPEEGTAKELLKEIKLEKEKLVKEGKIKKSKALASITEDEIPFDIPENWEWVRLGDIGLTNIGLTYKPTDIIHENGTAVLRSNNIQDGKIVYDDMVYVKTTVPSNKMCNTGDILICARNGSKRLVGKAAVIEHEGMSFGTFMAIFKPLSLDSYYVLSVINSAYFRNTLLNDTGTTTINQITQTMLKNFLIPLPPLSEQHRIVAKIEELMPLCDKLVKTK